MSTNKKTTTEEELQRLEIQTTELLQACEQLREENHLLKTQQKTYSSEREKLFECQEQARVRVEAILNRLKAIEES